MPTNFPTPTLDKGSQELTEEYIRIRAYELFERRGGHHGHDLEDWFEAEAEILGQKHQPASAPHSRNMRMMSKRAAAGK